MGLCASSPEEDAPGQSVVPARATAAPRASEYESPGGKKEVVPRINAAGDIEYVLGVGQTQSEEQGQESLNHVHQDDVAGGNAHLAASATPVIHSNAGMDSSNGPSNVGSTKKKKKKKAAASVFDRLTDPKGFTGIHRKEDALSSRAGPKALGERTSQEAPVSVKKSLSGGKLPDAEAAAAALATMGKESAVTDSGTRRRLADPSKYVKRNVFDRLTKAKYAYQAPGSAVREREAKLARLREAQKALAPNVKQLQRVLQRSKRNKMKQRRLMLRLKKPGSSSSSSKKRSKTPSARSRKSKRRAGTFGRAEAQKVKAALSARGSPSKSGRRGLADVFSKKEGKSPSKERVGDTGASMDDFGVHTGKAGSGRRSSIALTRAKRSRRARTLTDEEVSRILEDVARRKRDRQEEEKEMQDAHEEEKRSSAVVNASADTLKRKLSKIQALTTDFASSSDPYIQIHFDLVQQHAEAEQRIRELESALASSGIPPGNGTDASSKGPLKSFKVGKAGELVPSTDSPQNKQRKVVPGARNAPTPDNDAEPESVSAVADEQGWLRELRVLNDLASGSYTREKKEKADAGVEKEEVVVMAAEEEAGEEKSHRGTEEANEKERDKEEQVSVVDKDSSEQQVSHSRRRSPAKGKIKKHGSLKRSKSKSRTTPRASKKGSPSKKSRSMRGKKKGPAGDGKTRPVVLSPAEQEEQKWKKIESLIQHGRPPPAWLDLDAELKALMKKIRRSNKPDRGRRLDQQLRIACGRRLQFDEFESLSYCVEISGLLQAPPAVDILGQYVLGDAEPLGGTAQYLSGLFFICSEIPNWDFVREEPGEAV